MADDDEIDILGDFSFNSCFAQNNQGIPSCSSREDTVHPQWLSDSTETNWYDKDCKNNFRDRSGSSKKLLGAKVITTSTITSNNNGIHTIWSQAERNVLVLEMAKYGRNVKKISQTLRTKTEAEIQALIDAEHGIHLEPSSYGLDKCEDHEDIPSVVQEEIVTHTNIRKVVINPPIIKTKHPFRRKNTHKAKALEKFPAFESVKPELISPEEIFYDNDMVIGSTESIGSELDMSDIVSKNIAKCQAKVKGEKKIGNHRKVSRNYDKGKSRNISEGLLKSPKGRQRKDSSLSDDSVKSPKMQIVLGSGVALPVSEGEQVIKIEKKKDSEPESDIEIDIESDNEGSSKKVMLNQNETKAIEEPIAVPLRKFELMPRRQKKKINLDGGGGYTIMHTDAGDLLEVGSEPKREKQPRKQPIHLIRCRIYNAEKPAPYEVRLFVSTLILMDVHAHSSRGEVMGLVGGTDGTDDMVGCTDGALGGTDGAVGGTRVLTVRAYMPAAAAAGSTHCDMDPVSQSMAAQQLVARGVSVCGWHHSHPHFPCAPSAQDLRSQQALQHALEWHLPLLGIITSQHWPPGRQASQYRCLRVEEDSTEGDTPVGYQFSVKLVPDLSADNLPEYVREVSGVLRDTRRDGYSVDMATDVCPQANLTYLEKCISSIHHHMRSAGYAADDPLPARLVQALRDVLR